MNLGNIEPFETGTIVENNLINVWAKHILLFLKVNHLWVCKTSTKIDFTIIEETNV